MANAHYTSDFYASIRNGSTQSAEIILPLVLALLPVASVVDVGCGDGSWLAVFRKLGVRDVVGLDGEYVAQDLLQIPHDCFQAFDLTKPFHLERVFDLAVSLEVAEHLPSESGPAFVESLVRLAPLVLFSAAIPLQGGVNHINERWPDHWAELFQKHSFVPVDCVRKHIWRNDRVEWWYVQNILVFARKDVLKDNAALKREFELTNPDQLSLVHPRVYLQALAKPTWGVRLASKYLLHSLKVAILRRMKSQKAPQ